MAAFNFSQTAGTWRERAIELALLACGLLSIVTSAGILMVLAVETWHFFSEVSFAQFFGDTQWTPLFFG